MSHRRRQAFHVDADDVVAGLVQLPGGQAHIYGDVDGDGRADLHIVAVTLSLNAADFML